MLVYFGASQSSPCLVAESVLLLLLLACSFGVEQWEIPAAFSNPVSACAAPADCSAPSLAGALAFQRLSAVHPVSSINNSFILEK